MADLAGLRGRGLVAQGGGAAVAPISNISTQTGCRSNGGAKTCCMAPSGSRVMRSGTSALVAPGFNPVAPSTATPRRPTPLHRSPSTPQHAVPEQQQPPPGPAPASPGLCRPRRLRLAAIFGASPFCMLLDYSVLLAAAAPGATLSATVICVAIGGALVLPSLGWLLVLAQRPPARG